MPAPVDPGDIVYCDASLDRIVRWRPSTGETEDLANIPILGSAGGIALDTSGNVYSLVSPGGFDPAAVISRWDMVMRELVPFSDSGLIVTGNRMIVSSDGQSLLVTGEGNSGLKCLFKVDIATGEQSILTTNFHSRFMDLVPAVEHPFGIAHAPGGKLIIVDKAYAHVVEFNEDGSGRRLIKELPYPILPTGVAVGPDGRIYVCVLNNEQAVLAVDSATGELTPVGDHTLVQAPGDIGVGLGGLLVGDAGRDAIIRIDLTTGAETVALAGVPSARTIFEFSEEQPNRPPLTIRRSPGGVTVSWMALDSSWRLESSSSFGSANGWEPVPNVPAGAQSVELPVTSAHLWFRLKK
jgi:sugar lactone lactonase YvrE